MLEWWNDIRMLVARYLVASEQMERSGPVAAAVRQAGYVSEEEVSDQEDGSSFEAEEGEDADGQYVENNNHQVMPGHHDEPVPTYTQPQKDSGIRLGEHGYAIDKKQPAEPDSNANGDSSRRSRRVEKAPETGANRQAAEIDEA